MTNNTKNNDNNHDSPPWFRPLSSSSRGSANARPKGLRLRKPPQAMAPFRQLAQAKSKEGFVRFAEICIKFGALCLRPQLPLR